MKKTNTMKGLFFLLALVSLSAIVFASGGTTDGPASGLYFNGSRGAIIFNCTAYVAEEGGDVTLDNVSFWSDFDGSWGIDNTSTDVGNASQFANFSQKLPTTQGTYTWNCKFSSNKTANQWVNTTNQTLYIDTTAPLLVGGTVSNGSVIIAGQLGGIYVLVADSGGSGTDEATSYAGSLQFKDAADAAVAGTFSSPGEGYILYDISTDIQGPADTLGNYTVLLNLTDNVGNVRTMVKYTFSLDLNPNGHYASEFNSSLYGGTNLSKINVSDAGRISGINMMLNNTYGYWNGLVNFTGLGMNINGYCDFAQNTVGCIKDNMCSVSGSPSIKFYNTGFSAEPRLYKSGVQYSPIGSSWDSTNQVYSATVDDLVYFQLVSNILGGSGGAGGGAGYAICGDGTCSIPIESATNCPYDCGSSVVPVDSTTPSEGFVPITQNAPVINPPTATTPDDSKDFKKFVWIFGMIIGTIIVLLIIVGLSATKSSRRRRR